MRTSVRHVTMLVSSPSVTNCIFVLFLFSNVGGSSGYENYFMGSSLAEKKRLCSIAPEHGRQQHRTQILQPRGHVIAAVSGPRKRGRRSDYQGNSQPCSQQQPTGPYLRPDQSTSHPHAVPVDIKFIHRKAYYFSRTKFEVLFQRQH